MTAAILRHELLADLPSRRLRHESEGLQAPAMLFAASLVATLLFALGAIPSAPPRTVPSPTYEPGFEFLPDLLTPPAGPVAMPQDHVLVDPHVAVRPVDRAEDALVVDPVLQAIPTGSGQGPESISEGGAQGGISTGGGGQAVSDPQPGDAILADELPEVTLVVRPQYPSLARDAGVEGTVTVWALVGLDGSVEEVRVRKSIPMLDSAALEAVRRWRFTPALAGRHPVRVWVAIPVRFRLHG